MINISAKQLSKIITISAFALVLRAGVTHAASRPKYAFTITLERLERDSIYLAHRMNMLKSNPNFSTSRPIKHEFKKARAKMRNVRAMLHFARYPEFYNKAR